MALRRFIHINERGKQNVSRISKLKQEDAHFARLFDEHNELDDKITGLVNNPVTSGSEEIEELKKAKLKLKDELYALLQKASGK